MRPLYVTVLAATLAVPAWARNPPPVPTNELVAALAETLRDDDIEVRLNAAVALAAVGPEAVDALIAAVADPKAEARAAAAYALGQMGGPAAPATAALVKALKDKETDVRRQSALALARIVQGQKASAGSLFQPPPRPVAPTPPPPEMPRP